MPRHAVLNNVDHKDLRVIRAHGERFGDDVMAAVTFPAEFRSVQSHYPIVFQKSQDGTTFQPLALFGLREGENLFLRGGGWDAAYVPLAIERQPFLVGFDGAEPVVHVDLDSPRVSRSEGEPVFLPFGGISDYLEQVNSMLLALHQGLQSTPAFVAALLAHDLLEPFSFDIERPDGTQRLAGFYTVHEERLQKLDGTALAQLHQAGHLLPIYMVLASTSHLRDLADRACQAGNERVHA
ncbi:SapC family protein [Ideonella sp. BN130291]|uniref:SapC family protein n=1 Tax=Ideonella sp. BN130291 TaxID=3112940 RepID=UPI002E26F1F2|nr:SapC family protein [Ideonella sp. BN130291]